MQEFTGAQDGEMPGRGKAEHTARCGVTSPGHVSENLDCALLFRQFFITESVCVRSESEQYQWFQQ